MLDRYAKVVLTVIAIALAWLCLWGPGPKWGTPAHASSVGDAFLRGVEAAKGGNPSESLVAAAVTAELAKPSVFVSGTGRFQIQNCEGLTQGDDGRGARANYWVLLDTQTGRVWRWSYQWDEKGKKLTSEGWRVCHVEGLVDDVPF